MKKKYILMTFLFIFMPFTNVLAMEKVTCGNITNIPVIIPRLTNLIISIVQIAVPVILVIMGSIDLIRGITSQKDEEIKKGYQTLIKRLIIGAMIFFSIVIVKLIVGIAADSADKENIVSCIDCFLSGESNCKS